MMLVAMASCNTQPENGNEKAAHEVEPQKENIALAGKKFKYDYGDTVYEINFKSENQLHWHCIEGEEKGRQADESYSSLRLNEHTLFVSWVEEDGLGVSQVINLKKQHGALLFKNR